MVILYFHNRFFKNVNLRNGRVSLGLWLVIFTIIETHTGWIQQIWMQVFDVAFIHEISRQSPPPKKKKTPQVSSPQKYQLHNFSNTGLNLLTTIVPEHLAPF